MKIALFLGAGASVFTGHPTAEGLMKTLKKRVKDDWSMGGATERIMEGYDDIEKLYDGIDRMLSMRDGVRDDAHYGIRNVVPIVRALYGGDGSFKATLDELERLKPIIDDILRESFKDAGDPGLIARMYGEVTRFIEDCGSDELHVFTTNYDMVIEEYARECGLELVTGSEYRRSTDNVWVGKWKARTNNTKRLYLTKLHGSVNLYEDGRMLREAEDVTRRPSGRSFMIPPTEGPKDYSGVPFSILMKRFEEEMVDVELLLVIGYSYRDDDIADIIWKRLDSGEMKMIAVSPTIETNARISGETELKPVQANVITLFKANKRVFLIDERFEPDTIDAMCGGWLKTGFDHLFGAGSKGNVA